MGACGCVTTNQKPKPNQNGPSKAPVKFGIDKDTQEVVKVDEKENVQIEEPKITGEDFVTEQKKEDDKQIKQDQTEIQQKNEEAQVLKTEIPAGDETAREQEKLEVQIEVKKEDKDVSSPANAENKPLSQPQSLSEVKEDAPTAVQLAEVKDDAQPSQSDSKENEQQPRQSVTVPVSSEAKANEPNSAEIKVKDDQRVEKRSQEKVEEKSEEKFEEKVEDKVNNQLELSPEDKEEIALIKTEEKALEKVEDKREAKTSILSPEVADEKVQAKVNSQHQLSPEDKEEIAIIQSQVKEFKIESGQGKLYKLDNHISMEVPDNNLSFEDNPTEGEETDVDVGEDTAQTMSLSADIRTLNKIQDYQTIISNAVASKVIGAQSMFELPKLQNNSDAIQTGSIENKPEINLTLGA